MESQSRERLLSDVARSERIAELNDQLRTGGIGGQLMVSRGLQELTGGDISSLLSALAAFDSFDDDSDPYGERDFGLFEFRGAELMWKVDYYGDPEFRFGSSDPANADITWRVLTVLLATEY